MIPVAGYLLAGGQSSRMGSDKAFLQIDDVPLIERAAATLAQLCDPVAILTNNPTLARFGRLIPDAVPNCGPLGGIVAALEDTSHEWNLILAVDLPFLPSEALARLLAAAHTPEARLTDALAVIPVVDGVPQPLCAAYSRHAFPFLRESLHTGQWKVMAAIRDAGPVILLPFAETDWFLNLNTPEDMASARASLSRA